MFHNYLIKDEVIIKSAGGKTEAGTSLEDSSSAKPGPRSGARGEACRVELNRKGFGHTRFSILAKGALFIQMACQTGSKEQKMKLLYHHQ